MPIRSTRRVAALVATAALVLASSCSGDDGAAPAPTAPDATSPATAQETTPMTDAELATETYVAGYPLLVSLRTLQRFGGLIGTNALFWQTALSGPETRVIVAPNQDTLYSIAVLDLRAGPLALTVPDVPDRYYAYQLLDAWTESFAYVGTRATDARAGTWVITPPGWEGELPVGTGQIEATTPLVFLLGRFLVDDEADIADVLALRDQVGLQPLAALTGDPAPPAPPPLGDPAGAPQGVPTDAAFFTELSAALTVVPPTTPAQRDLVARAEEAGILGADGTAPTADEALLDEAAAAGDARIDRRASGTGGGTGWSDPGRVGTYGDDLDQRALVARIGWGANVAEEAVYRVARTDGDGEVLDGSVPHVLRFPADALPPVDSFWSLTAYGPDMFFVANPEGIYAVGDRSPDLAYEDDGSLEVVVSHDEPPARDDGTRPLWLPVPEGPFVLMMRLYLPQPAAIDGTWTPPPVEPLG